MLDLLTAHAPAFMDLLPEDAANRLKDAATLTSYGDGQLIHNRGDDKPGLSIVHTGAAQAGVLGEDGSFVLTSILGPGQIFGEFTLFAGLPRTHDMTASGPTEIYQLTASRFTALYDSDPAISRALLSSSLARTHLLLEMMDAIRRLPLPARTAKVLVNMMQTTRDQDRFECRQSDLAFTLGVSRMSLNKALKELAEAGLIETGYGVIKLVDRPRLLDWLRRYA